jgi:hypothetical protein
MSDRWIREFESIIGSLHHGLAFCDLADAEQQQIIKMRDSGFTPEEAYEVIREGTDVE